MSQISPQKTVIIGSKPAMNYVTACLTLFNAGASTVTVRARGKAISHAVDSVELLRRAFVKNLRIQDIVINTEELMHPRGSKIYVSTIDIVISKPNN